MKNFLLFVFVFVMNIFANAQEFVRVYNLSGDRIAKGYVVYKDCTDSLLVLQKNQVADTIPIQLVSYLKTKHGAGHNIFIGAAIGAPIGAILGGASAATVDNAVNTIDGSSGTPDVGAGIAAGLISGAVTGGAVGAITAIFKNSKKIKINGNIQTWHQIRTRLL